MRTDEAARLVEFSSEIHNCRLREGSREDAHGGGESDRFACKIAPRTNIAISPELALA
jgi:hypothetical protein